MEVISRCYDCGLNKVLRKESAFWVETSALQELYNHIHLLQVMNIFIVSDNSCPVKNSDLNLIRIQVQGLSSHGTLLA